MIRLLKFQRKFNLIILAGLSCLFISHSSYSVSLYDLSKNPVWLKLLHYRNGKSEIDDPDFFLSKKGNKDPLLELKATIRAFLKSKELGDKNPICMYPARFEFLNKYLNLKRKIKKFPHCQKLNEFLKEVNPHSISIIFSDYYLNSPASMYGHTFIRINPPFKSSLLGYSVNFAANANRSEGILYYIKGLIGLYKGYYSIFPYYKKIFEYNNLESRNLWEYSLNLSPKEVRFITLHVWELKNRYSYYYFFNKNCSYHVLYLIDVVKPEYNLTEHFKLWVIPIDTIRLLREKGLIKRYYFRPSTTTIINTFLEKNTDLSKNDILLAKKIAKFKIKPSQIIRRKDIAPKKKAEILELSKYLFMYFSIKNKMPQKLYKKRLLKLLSVRSKVGIITPLNIKPPIPPEKGHKPSKVSISFGSDDRKFFYQFRFRTAYHELEDSDKGFLKGSEVVFPSFSIRYYPNQNKAVLNSLTFVRITSISPENLIFKPISWYANASISRDWINNEKEHFFNAEFSLGKGYGKRFLSFLGFSSGIQLNLKYATHSRIPIGIRYIGVLGINKLKQIFYFYPHIDFYHNHSKSAFDIGYKMGYHLKTNLSLVFTGKYNVRGKNSFLEYFSSLNIFF